MELAEATVAMEQLQPQEHIQILLMQQWFRLQQAIVINTNI